MRDAQRLYNTRFAAGCQQFLQRFLHLFQIFSFGLFLIKITLVFPLPWPEVREDLKNREAERDAEVAAELAAAAQ